jgi:AhpD family alkylhydroperoxidase
MQSRMKSPVQILPKAMEAMQQLAKAAEAAGLSRQLHELLNLRASQINGCAVCVDMHSRALVKMGEKPERMFAVAAWRETPYFTDAERAALALTEAVTRIADRPDPVPDEIWNEAARHYDERMLAAIVLSIATINVWNRLNAATRQITGPWIEQFI